ncbi:hypothetical protein LTS18_009129 [Coniosporium uncinatum]|uniref:Uncharacterized protein n=1 Tax=Coniosporium uncinatum TaxID=93489 RepID=A0ACC3DMA4_9PEZI|nr:hypothetical protein LTS18_009129 [Coniosporium uncinatum]
MTTEYTAFYCEPTSRWIYMLTTAVLGVGGVILPWHPTFNRADMAWARVGFYVVLAATGFTPFIQLTYTRGLFWAAYFYEPITKSIFVYLTGAILYAAKVPERWFPGWFDYASKANKGKVSAETTLSIVQDNGDSDNGTNNVGPASAANFGGRYEYRKRIAEIQRFRKEMEEATKDMSVEEMEEEVKRLKKELADGVAGQDLKEIEETTRNVVEGALGALDIIANGVETGWVSREKEWDDRVKALTAKAAKRKSRIETLKGEKGQMESTLDSLRAELVEEKSKRMDADGNQRLQLETKDDELEQLRGQVRLLERAAEEKEVQWQREKSEFRNCEDDLKEMERRVNELKQLV